MDRIIKLTLGLFVILLVSFVAVTAYNGYVGQAYRSTLSSTYSYTCTLSTNSPLTNVTLFLPVPADPTGNSPVIERMSAQQIPGIPDTWRTELYETGKGTFVKVTASEIIPPAGTTTKDPYTITLSADIPSKRLIDTRDPVAGTPLFRPAQGLKPVACHDRAAGAAGGQCFTYLTTLYAKYETDPNAAVTFRSDLTGKNSWTIFEPRTNEYRTSAYLLMFGEQKGWTPVAGYLEQGIGAYDAPALDS
ncbi:hypothetical protein [Methanoregula formicica]|uniref:Uncharacterized protein n=1 Tax=Methanoregula formicica (strain DSM 22288 / NBRC 105244 / SMSP) TaxID=593750 RepID=L0HJ82_METFS|nr:hypothetical protein [Methanoregula formicica]AGB03134.1 hypothetical protein Metfor_2127 [Methanoregula formicica SMSP]